MLPPANELLRLFLATNQMRLCDRAPSNTTWSQLLEKFPLLTALAVESVIETKRGCKPVKTGMYYIYIYIYIYIHIYIYIYISSAQIHKNEIAM